MNDFFSKCEQNWQETANIFYLLKKILKSDPHYPKKLALFSSMKAI